MSSKFFCDALLGVRVLGLIFSATSFPSIDAVGSEFFTRLYEYINCDTHRKAPKNSSIKIPSVRVLDFDVVAWLGALHLLIVLSSLGRFRWP